jgi:hypothetical protein
VRGFLLPPLSTTTVENLWLLARHVMRRLTRPLAARHPIRSVTLGDAT